MNTLLASWCSVLSGNLANGFGAITADQDAVLIFDDDGTDSVFIADDEGTDSKVVGNQ